MYCGRLGIDDARVGHEVGHGADGTRAAERSRPMRGVDCRGRVRRHDRRDDHPRRLAMTDRDRHLHRLPTARRSSSWPTSPRTTTAPGSSRARPSTSGCSRSRSRRCAWPSTSASGRAASRSRPTRPGRRSGSTATSGSRRTSRRTRRTSRPRSRGPRRRGWPHVSEGDPGGYFHLVAGRGVRRRRDVAPADGQARGLPQRGRRRSAARPRRPRRPAVRGDVRGRSPATS